MENLYSVLGIDKMSSQEDIKKAYRQLAGKHHPDKGGDPEVFKKIQIAYDILSDTNRKKIYDETGNTSNYMNEDRSILAQFTKTALSHINIQNYYNVDIFTIIERMIDSTISQTQGQLADARARVVIESLVISKVKKKNTIVYTVMEENLNNIKKTIEQLEERIVILDRVKDIFLETKNDPEQLTPLLTTGV